MNTNNTGFEDTEEAGYHRVKRFNKERYCKKNKLGHGQYGEHYYVNDRCQYCNKIDPYLKYNRNKGIDG
jgi:hypothetical protein